MLNVVLRLPGSGEKSGNSLEKKNSNEKKGSNEKKISDESKKTPQADVESSAFTRTSVRRKSEANPQLDRDQARNKLQRFPRASLRLTRLHGSSPVMEDISAVGLLLTSKIGGVAPPSQPPDWAYGQGNIRLVNIDSLPPGTGLIVHPGEQRLYIRHAADPVKSARSSSLIQVLLDITGSDNRDRFIIQDNMEFIFETPEGERISVVVRLPANEYTDFKSAWMRKIGEGERWKLWSRTDEGSSFSSECYNDAKMTTTSRDTTLAPPSVVVARELDNTNTVRNSNNNRNLSETKPKKSLTWGMSYDLVEGTASTIKTDLDNERAQTEGMCVRSQQEGGGGDDRTHKQDMEIFVDGIRQFAFSDGKACVNVENPPVGGNQPPTSIEMEDASAATPSAPFSINMSSLRPGTSLASFMLERSSCQLLTPRAISQEEGSKGRVFLVIPPNVAFPLQVGDAIVVRKGAGLDRQQLCRFDICSPKLSRSVPSDEETRQQLNPSHLFSELALEVTHQKSKQRWNGSVDTNTNSIPYAVHFTKKFFAGTTRRDITIGRASTCDITVSDPHLSRHHCTVRRVPNSKYCVIDPVDDKKNLYLLCGKTDSHARPPVALRTGDSISIGRSEFKVVFQQRGNRVLNDASLKSARDELRQRLYTMRAMFELDVKKQAGENSSMSSPFSSQTTSASNPEASLDADDADEELNARFARLNPSASESSATFQEKLRKSSVVSNTSEASKSTGNSKPESQSSASPAMVPLFKNIDSLLETFENRTFGKEPIMILMAMRGPSERNFYLCSPLETTIGRSVYANISISNDKRMSQFHCRVFFDTDLERWVLDDMSSKHGTFLKIDEPLMLSAGDVVVAGLTLIRILGKSPTPNTGKEASTLWNWNWLGMGRA